MTIRPFAYSHVFLGILFLFSFLFFLGGRAFGGDVSLIWSPNTESDLKGYKIYIGTSPGVYGNPVDVGNVTAYTISTLTAGTTYYFAITAYDTETPSNESNPSLEVSKTIPIGSGDTPPPLGDSTLLTPAGRFSTTKPTYAWNAVQGASWYQIWINDSTGNILQQWIRATDAGCGLWLGTCVATPNAGLVMGNGVWWVRGWNEMQRNGPWSQPLNFTVSASAGEPSLVPPLAFSPSGTGSEIAPSFFWGALPDATWYQVWVNDSTGTVSQKWYTASEAGCLQGTGTCSVNPGTLLATGNAKWWVRGWNSGELHGPWSPVMNFTVQ